MNSVRKTLDQFGIRPRKKLGQSFLEDMNMIRKIVSLTEPSRDDTIVEIGAGLGFMTEELACKAGRVIALEIDPRLLDVLGARFAGNPRVEIVAGDVLDYDFSAPSSRERIKVVGNIPYRIASPILFHLLAFRRSIASMVLMFQKELADRIMSPPGSKAYGIPSVILAMYAVTVRELTVPPTCFYPVPSVVSSVLRIVMRDRPCTEVKDEALFSRLVRTAFARRRKTLWNNLRDAGLPEGRLREVLLKTGIESGRRAETLSVEEFGRLAAAWSAARIAEK
jgi:16S rRNA (adenine1518-N6/adenine1519-N6)-dimethyltransferase